MKKLVFLLFLFALSHNAQAFSSHEYSQRFNQYFQWHENLPAHPNSQFLTFIQGNNFLATRLRERWLYQLAKEKNWPTYDRYYQPSNSKTLQCYAGLAAYYSGKKEQAQTIAKTIWLTADSLPPPCNQLINLVRFDEALITKRLILTLEKRNLPLARHLLKQYSTPRLMDEKLLLLIDLHPTKINLLKPNLIHSYFYLYGLQRMAANNPEQAIRYWQQPLTKKILTHAQQQAFLVYITLYKAMRNQDDTAAWFAQIKPDFYTDTLLEWQIRFALKQQQWAKVQQLINAYRDKNNPCWQYWLARAKEALGHKVPAKQHYQTIAANRNYYGFLASRRLQQNFSFNNENPVTAQEVMQPYQSFTRLIKELYQKKQLDKASSLLNDFASELPKKDKSALAYWVAAELHWYGKSIVLSNNDQLINQLALRFPLAYRKTIERYARLYHIPLPFTYAIIRQESAFQQQAVSSVGARGLMQIMPATAKLAAKHEHIAYRDKRDLFKPKLNIQLGIAYLANLAKHFNNQPLLMAAAYNAGPGQVQKWLTSHANQEIDIWIETLPWHETRNYLKNVIAFNAVYQYRLKQPINLNDFFL